MALPAARLQWLPILLECSRIGGFVSEEQQEAFGRKVLSNFPPGSYSSTDLARSARDSSKLGTLELRYVEIQQKAFRQMANASPPLVLTRGTHGSWSLTREGGEYLQDWLSGQLPTSVLVEQAIASEKRLWQLVPNWVAHVEQGTTAEPKAIEVVAKLVRAVRNLARGSGPSASGEPPRASVVQAGAHRYSDRVEVIAEKIREFGDSATISELYDALATGPTGLFATPRRIAASIRWDMRQEAPLFEREGNTIRLTAREAPASTRKQLPSSETSDILTSELTVMAEDQVSKTHVCVRGCGSDMRAANHTHSLMDGGKVVSICCPCARREGFSCRIYLDGTEQQSKREAEDDRPSKNLSSLGLAAAAWPHLKGRERKIALNIGDDISLKEASAYLRGELEHHALASSFGTVRQKRNLQNAIDLFGTSADRWAAGQFREPKLNWLTPESLNDENFRLREDWLESWRSRFEVCNRVRIWLPLLSVEAINVLRKISSADYAFLSTVLGRASLLIAEEGALKPWRATFRPELGMLPVGYVYQVDATNKLDRILSRLAYAGCQNVGHLVILDQEAWQLSRELPSSEWGKLKLDLERLG